MRLIGGPERVLGIDDAGLDHRRLRLVGDAQCILRIDHAGLDDRPLRLIGGAQPLLCCRQPRRRLRFLPLPFLAPRFEERANQTPKKAHEPAGKKTTERTEKG